LWLLFQMLTAVLRSRIDVVDMVKIDVQIHSHLGRGIVHVKVIMSCSANARLNMLCTYQNAGCLDACGVRLVWGQPMFAPPRGTGQVI
jgi:hypothetical protein